MATKVDPSASYMPLPKGIARGNPVPIDKTIVWSTKDEMKDYAENDATAYVGQIVSLVTDDRTEVYFIRDISGNVDRLPIESEISSSIGPMTGSIEDVVRKISAVSSSVSTLSGGVETLSGNAEAADISISDTVSTLSSNALARDNALSDAIGQKIAQTSISTSISDKSTNEQVPGSLATYNYVNSSINNLAAYYITADASGNAFATRAALTAATASGELYNGGVKRVPTKNDYCLVKEDETQTLPGTTLNPTTRYVYDGSQWAFQYIVNNTTLTQAQIDALNSGVTATVLSEITGSIIELSGNASSVDASLSSSIWNLSSVAKTRDDALESAIGAITGSGGGVPALSGFVTLSSNQTVSGVKTFSTLPILETAKSALLSTDENGKITKVSGTAGLLYLTTDGTIGYKTVGTLSSQVAAGNHNHIGVYAPASTVSFPGFGGNGSATTASHSDHNHDGTYATTSTTSTLSGYITSLQSQINALSGIYLKSFFEPESA